jgi:ATP synthase subunit 6
MYSQASRTLGHHLKGFPSILTSLFLLILITNLSGLFPYIFRASRHLIITLSLGLPFWFSLIISSLINSPKTFMASLLPGGAPDWLNPFLVLIETIRTLVRPITLSFRLAANIRAGHIVITLLGIFLSSSISSIALSTMILLPIQTFYITFELGICLIQAYIFCLLLSLYADDHTS